ncbi:helix-turn-helix domain-containing protein [Paenibacillus antri]|uniref:Helix-turn-helix domain-containing protein n=1 Tax=Paenibacillus antri TaxID=2582848 RepID=A0A5R9G691_9BACL|nr:AraC family transcriptional regulator [Paenibacillus antri]TLS51897.1 helix-turn-helix domain-containing protein [Paenibacillus antri]
MRIREYGTLKMQPSGAGGVHPYHEILYIESGDSELQWMDRCYRLPAPCLVLIPENTPHWLTPRTPELLGWYLETDMESAPFLEYDAVLSWNQRQSRNDAGRSWPQPLYACIAAVSSIVEAYERGELLAPSAHRLLEWDIQKLLFLVKLIVSAPADNVQPTPAIDKQLYTALRYMERSFKNNITIEELAGICHLTPSYVIRLFKQTFGATPIQYLQELRLKAAISYLGTTDMPIQDIAETTGFANLHYFSRMFKQKVGESPTAWRKRRREPSSGS